MKSEDFLDIYRQLEDALEEKYLGKKRRHSSLVIEFLNSNESIKYREKLNLAREIRNLLSHSAKFEGEDLITPSDSLGESLKEIINFVQKPPLAIEFATKRESISRASLNQGVLQTMREMQRRGFSHVPIFDNDEFVGVFSRSTIFEYVLSNGQNAIGKHKKLGELKNLLPVENHNENYLFVPKTFTVFDAIKAFECIKSKNKRISVIFITENGKTSETILGMLTPLDVMGSK